MKQCGVYKLTNLINNKIYIGKSVDIKRRISRHKHSEKSVKGNSFLERAIRKYGWSNFSVSVIEDVEDVTILLDRECFWIRFYKATDAKIGYNMCERASDWLGRKHTEETKKKLSEINKGKCAGEKNYMYGKTHTAEARKKISDANQNNHGMNNPFYGRKHTKESMEKMIQSKKDRNGFKKGKPVYQIDKNTKSIIKEWESSQKAAEELLGKRDRHRFIAACCRGDRVSCFGFLWKYKKDYDSESS